MISTTELTLGWHIDNLLVAVPTNMMSTVTSLVSSACAVSVCTLTGQLSVTLHVLNNIFGLHYVLIYLLQILSTLTCSTCDTNKLHAPRGKNVLQISGAVDFFQQKKAKHGHSFQAASTTPEYPAFTLIERFLLSF